MDIKAFVKNHPYQFAVIIFIVNSLLPFPIVIAFKLLNLGLEPLRLFFPILMSIFAIVVLYYLGWLTIAGFGKKIQDIDVLWFPLVLAFVPVALFGTIEIPANLVLFYLLAVLFTGISEEGFSRGILINVLIPKGKWIAILFSAGLFGIGHFSNLFFESFTAIEMIEKLWVTMSFAILYGALFLRIRNIWPLIILHMIVDFSFVTSGTAGPFTVVPFPTSYHMIVGALSIVYAIYIVRKVNTSDILPELEKASSG
jgi:membrane protease YdiL (CAAX protease family)